MRNKYTVELFKNNFNNFYFHVKRNNGKIILTSKKYTRKEMALKVANQLVNDLKCNITFIDLKKDYEF